jgi:hypothetical protein
MGFPKYPASLSNARWQMEKGKLAKLFAKETGIGAQMVKLRTLADKLDVGKLSVSQSYKSVEAVDEAIKDCKSEFASLTPMRKEAYALRDLARKYAAEFKKNLLIPKSVSAYLLVAAKEADAYGVALKSYDPMSEFEEAKKKVLATSALQEKLLKDGLAKCVSAVNSVKGGKATPEDWNKKAWQAIRAYAAVVAKSPEMSTVQAEWKTLSSLGGDKLKDVATVTKHVNAVDALLKKTAPLVG